MSGRIGLIMTALLSLALLPAMTGCLSLGGRTTYVQESSETPQRISSLERRVGSLEQQYARLSGDETLVSTPSP